MTGRVAFWPALPGEEPRSAMFPRRAGLPIGAFVADLLGRSGRSWSLPQVQSVTGVTVHPGLEGHEGLQNRLLRPLACYFFSEKGRAILARRAEEKGIT